MKNCSCSVEPIAPLRGLGCSLNLNTGSTYGDIVMLRFNDIVKDILSLEEYLSILPKLSGFVLQACIEKMNESVFTLVKTANFIEGELTDSVEEEE